MLQFLRSFTLSLAVLSCNIFLPLLYTQCQVKRDPTLLRL